MLHLLLKTSEAQITITNLDFASPNDTVRTSVSTNVQGFDFVSSGANYSWNYSSLPFEGQRLDTFFTIKQAPPLFLLTFFNVSNLVTRLGFQQLLPGLEISTAWQFFNKGLTNYRDWGYGLIIADIPLPLRFTTPDLLYNFPLSYNQNFSSNAFLEFPLQGVGYISIARNRQNQVDGWGSLTTPYGTFPTIRVKSTVRESDSIYIDSIGQGIRINRSYIEYKWLAKNQKIPLLVATVDSVLGTFISYKDSLRNQTVGLRNPVIPVQNIYPQPFSDRVHFNYCTSNPSNVRINIYDSGGRILYTNFEFMQAGCHDRTLVWPAALGNSHGLHFLVVSDGLNQQTYKLFRSSP
jgi:hypothetical protein